MTTTISSIIALFKNKKNFIKSVLIFSLFWTMSSPKYDKDSTAMTSTLASVLIIIYNIPIIDSLWDRDTIDLLRPSRMD